MVSSATEINRMNVDEAFQVLGTGRVNILIYVILCLNFMYVPMHIFGDMFNTRIPPHHCQEHRTDKHDSSPIFWYSRLKYGNYVVPEKDDLHNDFGFFDDDRSCHLTLLDAEGDNKTTGCQFGHWFDTSYTGETIVSEWELVCENNSEVIFITIHVVAAVLGGILFAPFSDKYGRKALLLMCWSQMSLMSIGMYFVGDMSSYLVLRFLQRLNVEGAEQAIFILSCEMLPTHSREKAISGLYFFYGLGYTVLALKAYLSTSWRYLQLAISIGSIILLPINLFLPESPYWLVFMGREKAAEKFFREAARHNKSSLPPGFKLKREVVEDDGKHHHSHRQEESGKISVIFNNLRKGSKGHYKPAKNFKYQKTESRHKLHPHVGHFKELAQVLGNKMLRKDAIIASFIWAVSAFLYYGITVSGFNPDENAYLAIFLSGVAVIISSITTSLIFKKFGRKKPITAFCFLCGVSKILATAIPKKIGGVNLKILYEVLKFLAKLFAAAVINSIQLIVAELFPTTVRSTCVGIVSFLELLGAGMGMYFSILERVSLNGSTIAAGILTVIAGYFCRHLPETSNRPLPGTIVDLTYNYASVVEGIVRMMNKIILGVDLENLEKSESQSSSRSSSLTISEINELKRPKSSACLSALSKSTHKRSPSFPANLYRLISLHKGDIRINLNTSVEEEEEEEKNVKRAHFNLHPTTLNEESHINLGYISDDELEDVVTKL